MMLCHLNSIWYLYLINVSMITIHSFHNLYLNKARKAHTISDSGHEFQVTFQTNTNDSPKDTTSLLPGSDYSKPGMIRSSNSTEPHICVSVSSPKKKKITVSIISSFLERITQDYIAYTESLKKKSRSRYDYSVSGKWARICSLYEVQGLDTVALCPKNEALIQEDLNSFKSNKPFYKRIGFPYRYKHTFKH